MPELVIVAEWQPEGNEGLGYPSDVIALYRILAAALVSGSPGPQTPSIVGMSGSVVVGEAVVFVLAVIAMLDVMLLLAASAPALDRETLVV
jgi:hypothetical protein